MPAATDDVVCVAESFRVGALPGDLPGRQGQTFWKGYTTVRADHAILKYFPGDFAPIGSEAEQRARAAADREDQAGTAPELPPIRTLPGLSARGGTEHRMRDGSARLAQLGPGTSRRSKPRAQARHAQPVTATRSQPSRKSELEVPQTRRPRAVVGDAIYDLSTIRASVATPQEEIRELRDRSLRGVERWKFPHGRADADAIRGHLAALIDTDDRTGTLCKRLLIAGSPRHRELFSRAARGQGLVPEEKRAMSLDGPDGGYAVPVQLDPTIVPTSSGVINPLRAISRVEATTTDTWKGVTGEGPKARYRAEGTEADEGEVKLAQSEIKMESADWWEPAAYELGQDWSGLEPQIAGMLQRAKDELEADAFLTGTGEDEPYGLLTDATETVETAAKDLFTVGDLEALEDDLPDGFLANASFLGHRLTLKRVRGFTVEGAPIWVKVPGELPEINGLPAHELSSMAATVEGGDLILACGDFNYFLIVDRLGMSIRFAEQFGENRLPTGQMGVLALWRNGSKVLSKKAFRILKVKAA